MNTGFFIAKRYLFAKKSHNVINIISIISVAGVMVGTAGLIIVLSVFNGFSGLVVSLYDSFDPDIKISPERGKTFDPDALDIAKIKNTEGVEWVTFTLEESALIKYRDRQYIATIKGVDSIFFNIANINDKIIDGELLLTDNRSDYAIVGSGIAYSLSLNIKDPFNALTVYIPKKGKPVTALNPEEAFNVRLIKPAGVFAIQQDFDTKYILVPLRFARDIIGQDQNISAIEIGLKPGFEDEAVKESLLDVTDRQVKIETRLQQHDFLYKILKSEKWAVYFILSFILVIAIFNIIGSLTMLIIEKKKDINILRALGAEDKLIRNIFLMEGVMISLFGGLTGMAAGALICLLQQWFGFIKLDDGESFIVESYPVTIELMDFVYVFLIVFVIGYLAALYSSRNIARSPKVSL